MIRLNLPAIQFADDARDERRDKMNLMLCKQDWSKFSLN